MTKESSEKERGTYFEAPLKGISLAMIIIFVMVIVGGIMVIKQFI